MNEPVPTSSVDWPAVRAAAAFRLVLPRAPIGGRLGDRLGAGTGSSLEFQDHRPYSPGDDLRHVDWAGYARSEHLSIRMYREEVAPRIDLVLDVSGSMSSTTGKGRAHAELSALLACACAATVADTIVLTTGRTAPSRVHAPEEIERFLLYDTAQSALEEPHLPLRRRSLRVVVSDFLFPHDPDVLIPRLARDAAALYVVQLTAREEAEPEMLGGRRLVDVEGHGELEVLLDTRIIEDYRTRFNRLRLGLATASRRAGARFIHMVDGASPRELALSLARGGILEPS